MSKSLNKQICYALGTLGGWGLAKATGAKESVPFTILGGLIGFAASEQLFGADDGKVIVKPYAADRKKDDGQLSGTRRRAQPAVELVFSPAYTPAQRRKLTAKKSTKRPRRTR